MAAAGQNEFTMNISTVTLVQHHDVPAHYSWNDYRELRKLWGITCVQEGEGMLEYSDGTCEKLGMHSVAIIPPSTAYRFHVPPQSGHCLHYTINFRAELPSGDFPETRHAVILYPSRFGAIERLFEECLYWWTQKTTGYHMQVLGRVYQIVGTILETWVRSQVPEATFNQVVPARNYILDHYADEITLQTLSSLCSLSVTHFRRQFKSVYGTSPIEYQLHVRMDRAIDLLQQPELTIAQISALVGFQTPGYFTRFFHKRTGMTPTEYRRRLLGTSE